MEARILDCKGLKCPVPIVKTKKELDGMAAGEMLEVHATDPGSMADFRGWAKTAKTAELKDQRTETQDGREIYIHTFQRV